MNIGATKMATLFASTGISSGNTRQISVQDVAKHFRAPALVALERVHDANYVASSAYIHAEPD